MFSKEIINKFLVRYKNIPKLIIFKTFEHAKSIDEAFDILEQFPENLPVCFDFDKRIWMHQDISENILVEF